MHSDSVMMKQKWSSSDCSALVPMCIFYLMQSHNSVVEFECTFCTEWIILWGYFLNERMCDYLCCHGSIPLVLPYSCENVFPFNSSSLHTLPHQENQWKTSSIIFSPSFSPSFTPLLTKWSGHANVFHGQEKWIHPRGFAGNWSLPQLTSCESQTVPWAGLQLITDHMKR